MSRAKDWLGGKPVKKPKTRFELGDKMAVLQLAATIENLGASAYLGQAAMIEDKEILAAALSIHSVEARHAAALNVLTGETPTVDGSGFAKPGTMAEVLKTVQPFIVA
jgi:rubrerythrin